MVLHALHIHQRLFETKYKYLFWFLCIPVFFVLIGEGCKRHKESANITLTVEGKEFSDAQIFIDGKSFGRFTQTVINTDGEVYIDGVFQTSLPANSSGKKGDEYTGSIDSLILPAGVHTFTYLTSDGKNLEFSVDISPGYHLAIYFSDDEKIKWDDKSFIIVQGKSLLLPVHKIKK